MKNKKKKLKKNKVNGAMKSLTITEFGNPILRKKAKDIPLKTLKTPVFKKLIKDMFFTMNKAAGVGLAAPQIDKSIKLTVIGITSNNPRYKSAKKEDFQAIVVNPKILEYSKEKELDWEGCLSFPGVRGKVPRSQNIKIRYWDENGNRHIHNYSGFTARVFQHETDHLYGILFTDRLTDIKTLMTMGEQVKTGRQTTKKNRK